MTYNINIWAVEMRDEDGIWREVSRHKSIYGAKLYIENRADKRRYKIVYRSQEEA